MTGLAVNGVGQRNGLRVIFCPNCMIGTANCVGVWNTLKGLVDLSGWFKEKENILKLRAFSSLDIGNLS